MLGRSRIAETIHLLDLGIGPIVHVGPHEEAWQGVEVLILHVLAFVNSTLFKWFRSVVRP